FESGRWDEALALVEVVLAGEERFGLGQVGTACGICSARIYVRWGNFDGVRRLVDVFVPRARQHAVIQQLGPALIVAGLVETASGRPDAGARYADEYCELTRDTPAYRQMDVADLVRLLVASGKLEQAAAAAHNDVIPTIRNQCHSITADATLAAAQGASDAPDLFDRAAERWRAYGHPLETYLAVVSAAVLRQQDGAAAPGAGSEAPFGVSPL